MRRTTLFLTTILILACNNKPDALPGQSGKPSAPPSQPQASSTPLTASPAASTTTTSMASSSTSSTSAVTPSAAASGDPVVRNAGGTIDIDYNDAGQHHHLRGSSRESGKRKYTLDNGAEVLEVKPGDGHFKIRKADGTLLWKVKIGPKKIKVSDNEDNRDAVELRNGAHGVLEIQKIPIMQRAVIYAELLDRKL
jgi:hypothetical protein